MGHVHVHTSTNTSNLTSYGIYKTCQCKEPIFVFRPRECMCTQCNYNITRVTDRSASCTEVSPYIINFHNILGFSLQACIHAYTCSVLALFMCASLIMRVRTQKLINALVDHVTREWYFSSMLNKRRSIMLSILEQWSQKAGYG